jgi:hypothetical protein
MRCDAKEGGRGHVALKLKPDEQAMLDGMEGELVQRCMQFLVKLGEVYGAEEMVDIDFAFTGDFSTFFLDSGKDVEMSGFSFDLFKEAYDKGLKLRTTVVGGLAMTDECNAQWLGVNDRELETHNLMMENERKLGIMRCGSCTPYMCCDTNMVLYKKSVVSTESSAIPYWNSILGARCNRGFISTFFAAITGKYPKILYHLDENRYANTLVNVNVPLKNITDFGCLGVYVGKICGKDVPVFSGIKRADNPELISLGSALATGGTISLYHIPGITREFETIGEAMGGKPPKRVIEFGEAELQSVYRRYAGEKNEPVNWVFLGCPQATIFQMRQLADLFAGKKIAEGTVVTINVAVPTYDLADHMGYVKTLTDAGVHLVRGTCQIIGSGIPSAQYCYSHPEYSTGTLVTDSLKAAVYTPSALNAKKIILGSTEDCVAAAVNGKWGA